MLSTKDSTETKAYFKHLHRFFFPVKFHLTLIDSVEVNFRSFYTEAVFNPVRHELIVFNIN